MIQAAIHYKSKDNTYHKNVLVKAKQIHSFETFQEGSIHV